MAANSRPVDTGSAAPDFALPDGEGRVLRLSEARGSVGTLVAFICNHCPYVLHMRAELVRYAQDFAANGIKVVAINPNDPGAYPDETPQRIAEVARTLPFPYLVDASQDVARAYDAACTPDLYLYDSGMRLHYHGRFDSSRPNAGVATGEDLRAATWRLLGGQPAAEPQHASVGCSIKWKPGTAPQ